MFGMVECAGVSQSQFGPLAQFSLWGNPDFRVVSPPIPRARSGPDFGPVGDLCKPYTNGPQTGTELPGPKALPVRSQFLSRSHCVKRPEPAQNRSRTRPGVGGFTNRRSGVIRSSCVRRRRRCRNVEQVLNSIAPSRQWKQSSPIRKVSLGTDGFCARRSKTGPSCAPPSRPGRCAWEISGPEGLPGDRPEGGPGPRRPSGVLRQTTFVVPVPPRAGRDNVKCRGLIKWKTN